MKLKQMKFRGGVIISKNYTELGYENKEEWHELRGKAIGGSDVATIMHLNKYKNAQDLWKEKTGRKSRVNLDGNLAVQRGNKSENLLLEHFQINNGDYIVSKLDKTLRSTKYGFMIANLDGVVEHKELGKGVLEIKTATCHSWKVFESTWKDDVPLGYWLQIQHYMLVTGWKYAILYADIRLEFTEDKKHEIKMYKFQRNEEAIKQIIEAEIEFNSFLINDIEPPLTINL